ncbi:MAG: hypothetical protein AB1750_07060, partial [Chloroflexota bacterium]
MVERKKKINERESTTQKSTARRGMESKNRIFKNSSRKIFGLIWIVAFLAFGGLFVFSDDMALWLRIVSALIWLAFAAFLVYSIIGYATRLEASNEKIALHTLFGIKALEWKEIERVRGGLQGLILCGNNNKVKLPIDPNLTGYSEILGLIFKKRPDLFRNEEGYVSQGALIGLVLLGYVELLVFLGVY